MCKNKKCGDCEKRHEHHDHHDRCEHKKDCCNPIALAMGSYFLRVPALINIVVVNDIFADLEPAEATARMTAIEKYIADAAVVMRNAFNRLFNCERKKCCEGAAQSIADIGVGYFELALNIVLAKANPLQLIIAPDVGFLAQTLSGLNANVALVLANAGCPLVA